MVYFFMITCYRTNLQKADFQEEICAVWRFFLQFLIKCYVEGFISVQICRLSVFSNLLSIVWPTPFSLTWPTCYLVKVCSAIFNLMNTTRLKHTIIHHFIFFLNSILKILQWKSAFLRFDPWNHHIMKRTMYLLGLFIAAQILKDNCKQT